MMTYEPFRNRMDDDEDMPRGYEHVEICLGDEQDGEAICDLINDRLKQVFDVLNYEVIQYDDHFVWYVFEGTEKELAEMRKVIRRLSRGKPRFQVVFEGMN